jgi:hypothetical protein
MKSALRWIAVMPAAVAAYIVAQIIWVFTPLPDVLVQIGSSWGCPVAFILAGVYTAPSHKWLVGLLLSILLVGVGGLLIYRSIQMELTNPPLWALIGATLVPVFFSVVIIKSRHDDLGASP